LIEAMQGRIRGFNLCVANVWADLSGQRALLGGNDPPISALRSRRITDEPARANSAADTRLKAEIA
jgi:hypothetical protein